MSRRNQGLGGVLAGVDARGHILPLFGMFGACATNSHQVPTTTCSASRQRHCVCLCLANACK